VGPRIYSRLHEMCDLIDVVEMTRGRCNTMHARRATAQRTVLLVGRDLHEAERVRRLLPARVGIAHAPSQALCALAGADVVLSRTGAGRPRRATRWRRCTSCPPRGGWR